MAGKRVGMVTSGPAVKFEQGGKSFVQFAGGGVAEVFGPAEFEAEFGMTFHEFCEKQDQEEVEDEDE